VATESRFNFFFLIEKLNWQKGTSFSAHARVVTAFSKFPQHQTAHLFFIFSKLFHCSTAPLHCSTASPFLQSALKHKPLCAPSSRTHTEPHHTHLISTFSHLAVQKPQTPSQPDPLPLPLPLRLTPAEPFFFFENDCPAPLHRSISLPRTTQTRNRHPTTIVPHSHTPLVDVIPQPLPSITLVAAHTVLLHHLESLTAPQIPSRTRTPFRRHCRNPKTPLLEKP